MSDKKSKKPATSLPAVPYEPTAVETSALARHKKRAEAAPKLPRLKSSISEPDKKTGIRTANISLDHPHQRTAYDLIADAVGSGDETFVAGLIKDASGVAVTHDGGPDLERANYALSIVKGIKPRDQVEAMLAVQMAAIQIATMRTASLLGESKTQRHFETYERCLNKLARTFAAQVEGLKRYRNKGTQRFYVERVNVEKGGQAIVGPIDRGEG